MRALAHLFERLGQALGLVAVALIAALTFPVFYDAIARKAGAPSIWIFEVSLYALTAGVFLANAYALKKGNHFRVELLKTLFPKFRHGLDVLALVATLAFGVVIAVGGGILVHYSYVNDIHSASLLSTPLYLPQSVVPLGGLVLALQAAAMLMLGESPAEHIEV